MKYLATGHQRSQRQDHNGRRVQVHDHNVCVRPRDSPTSNNLVHILDQPGPALPPFKSPQNGRRGPEVELLWERQAATDMHETSHGSSIKQLGFHVIAHNGSVPQETRGACDTREEYYARHMRPMFALKEQAQGEQTKDMEDLMGPSFDKVTPTGETDGRRIVPGIIHEGFWQVTCANNATTEDSLSARAPFQG